MIIEKFCLKPKAKGQIEYAKKTYTVQNACKCGCSPHPFMYITDGSIGLNLKFEVEEELKIFKKAVSNLSLKPPFRPGVIVTLKSATRLEKF